MVSLPTPLCYGEWCIFNPQCQHAAIKERLNSRKADLLVSPSRSLAMWAKRHWKIPANRIQVVPNVFNPDARLLSANRPRDLTDEVWLGYFGRLEHRKGIDGLIRALDISLTRYPKLQVRFVGRAQVHPISGSMYDEYIRGQLSRHSNRLEFISAVPLEMMGKLYAETDIAIFPSLWENFPNVCLEAMSSACAVIGSKHGGMRDMIVNGKTGLLIDPCSTSSTVTAIAAMVENPGKRLKMGKMARQRILDEYSDAAIVPQMIRSYEAAIALHHSTRRVR